MEDTGYDFEFVQVEKPYESYTGNNVKLRYIYSYFERDVINVLRQVQSKDATFEYFP